MRVTLRDLLNNLGVAYEMGPYETCPWSVYDGAKGLTCNAEVRMNEDATLCEAEIMLIHDIPPANGAPIDIVFRIAFKISSGLWEAFQMVVRGDDKTNAFFDWERKGWTFFNACVQELKMDRAPDIDALLKKELDESGGGTGASGSGSSKAPKIKPQSLLGMKGGRGF